MSQDEQTHDLTALEPAELNQALAFFQERLIGQPQVIQALTNVLYKQNALLQRMLDTDAASSAGIPNDPTVLLLMGGSWGKSLAARLIPMALEKLDHGSLTVLTPLPQDPKGSLKIDPHAVSVPFATVVVENVETAHKMNARFVSNLAHLLDTGVIGLLDQAQKRVHPLPLGLSTFILTSSVADEEIREALNPETRLGFLPPQDGGGVDAEAMYEEVQAICERALERLPRELLREVDETIILRPLGRAELKQVFDLEIAHYQRAVFPGSTLKIAFEGGAKARLFAEAEEDLKIYGAHALRRVLQRHIDPLVYSAYNEGRLTKDNLEERRVVVSLEDGAIQVRLEPRNP